MHQSITRIAAIACLSAAAISAQAAGFDSNLIVNGNAESATTGWTAYAGTPMFSSVAYGSNWVLPTQSGPVDRGASLFVGGSGIAYAGGYQSADLGSFANAIASNSAIYTLSGYLGGWTNQGDNAMLYVSFLDGNSNLLSTASLGPMTAADRGNVTGLFFVQKTGFLPTGATSVKFELTMERLASSDNDGYADNLSFSISAVPEPTTYALMLLGMCGIGSIALARRRDL